MFLATNVDKQALLPMIDGVVKNLFHDPADAFYTGRVMDVLYDGVEIDCSAAADDKAMAAVCLSFDTNQALRKTDDTHYKFSVFGGVSITLKLFSLTIEIQ